MSFGHLGLVGGVEQAGVHRAGTHEVGCRATRCEHAHTGRRLQLGQTADHNASLLMRCAAQGFDISAASCSAPASESALLLPGFPPTCALTACYPLMGHLQSYLNKVDYPLLGRVFYSLIRRLANLCVPLELPWSIQSGRGFRAAPAAPPSKIHGITMIQQWAALMIGNDYLA